MMLDFVLVILFGAVLWLFFSDEWRNFDERDRDDSDE